MEAITLDNFPAYRDLTREISEHVQVRIGDYLGLLQPQFRPGAVFGQHMGSKDSPKTAGAAFDRFKTFFKEVAVSSNLDPEVPDPIEINWGKPMLCPLAYEHTLTIPGGDKRIAVATPLRFVLAWPEFTYAELQDLFRARTAKARLQESALHFAVLNFLMMGNKVLLRLFDDLGFAVRSERFAELGGIPLTTMSSPAGSVRPPDTVIAQVCRFSGTNAIEEVIDLEGWSNLSCPLGQFARELAGKSLTVGSN
jgi:hypothetical protein